MPTLTDCKQMIASLAKEKNWGTNLATKIYYAMIELGEAGDLWKHRKDTKYLSTELNICSELEMNHAIAEELIDTIFYCLHGLQCLDPTINPDALFVRKFKKNQKRNRVYVDDDSYMGRNTQRG